MTMTCLTAFAVAVPAAFPARTSRGGRCRARPAAAPPRWGAARLRVPARAPGGGRWRAAADGNGEAPAAADKAASTEVRAAALRGSLWRAVVPRAGPTFFAAGRRAWAVAWCSFPCPAFMPFVYPGRWVVCVVPFALRGLWPLRARSMLTPRCRISLCVAPPGCSFPVGHLAGRCHHPHCTPISPAHAPSPPPSASVAPLAPRCGFRPLVAGAVRCVCSSRPPPSAPPRAASSAPTGTSSSLAPRCSSARLRSRRASRRRASPTSRRAS